MLTLPTTSQIHEFFSNKGALGLHLKDFEARIEQQSMACDIWDAFNKNAIALIEAGTGTGKSLAYLIPAILWAIQENEQIIISTNTIALQEQLITKDIPLAIQVLGCTISVVRAIGAQNYVCLKRLEEEVNTRSLFDSSEDEELLQIDSFSRNSINGTKSDLTFLPSAALWEKVNVDVHACTNKKCPHFSNCFFFKAKKEMQEATLLVVNHHLLCADLALRMKNNNFTETAVLPPYKRIIFDEAHHLEEVAANHFALKVSRFDFLKILSDASTAFQNVAVEVEEIFMLRRSVQTHLTHFFEAVIFFVQEQKKSSFEPKLRILEKHREEPLWINLLVPRYEELLSTCSSFVSTLIQVEERLKEEKGKDDTTKADRDSQRSAITGIISRLSSAILALKTFFVDPSKSKVYWMQESLRQSNDRNDALQNGEVQLVSCSFDIAKLLRDNLLEKSKSCIFSSATLASNQSFSYIKSRLGIQGDPIEKIYSSPFDYEKNVLFGIPSDMPLPDSPSFRQKSIDAIYECLIASSGNAFVLFTSYEALKHAYDTLYDRLKEQGLVPMRQGEDHRHALIRRFKETSRAVLFATDSFWEGVDIVGDALRCVIIHKLPFHVPSDPMSQARCEHIESLGRSAFFDYSLPKAGVKLKQAFGRLIRHKGDRGSCICLDVRLIQKGYGKILKNSLPQCQEVFEPLEVLKKQMMAFYKRKR